MGPSFLETLLELQPHRPHEASDGPPTLIAAWDPFTANRSPGIETLGPSLAE